MQDSIQIDSFFEAFYYLTNRFAENRISAHINEFKPDGNVMPEDDWARFEQVAVMEQELDKAFPKDETIEYYFAPLETKEKIIDSYHFSLGLLLLGRPKGFDGKLNTESLINFYRNASVDFVISHFCDQISFEFLTEPAEICKDMTGFLTFIDSLLVKPQDKWNIMEIAANPVKHLEALRELIENVVSHIERYAEALWPLAEQEIEAFYLEADESELLKNCDPDISTENLKRVKTTPSLLLFNKIYGFDILSSETNCCYYVGIYAYRIIRLRKNKENALNFMNIMKLLSDETRFKALHHMRNRYSYGQELAERFNCTRNTMYYHLDRMKGIGFVESKSTEYRMLYKMNKKEVYEQLTALRDYLTDGWQPGDDEGQEDEPPEEKGQDK